MRRRALGGLLSLAMLLAACSPEPAPSIDGHWKAEDLRVQSLVLPIGPELLISERDITVPSLATTLQYEERVLEGNAITLRFALGPGLTFHLESRDRMFIDVPFVGKVFYRRIGDVAPRVPTSNTSAPKAMSGASSIDPQAANSLPPDKTEIPTAGASLGTPPPQATDTGRRNLDAAFAALQQGDPDTAIRVLDQALSSGHIAVGDLAADPRWHSLAGDIRFKALLVRHN